MLNNGFKNTSLGYYISMEDQKTIGIVGGGQLGRMLTLAAIPLGFKVVVINPSPNSPASQVGAEEIIADLYDPEAIKSLSDIADYITVEIEHLNADVLEQLEANGKMVNPSSKTIKLIQDKFKQKKFLKTAGIPVADFIEIKNTDDALRAFKEFDGKMILKTRLGAFDGRGNMVINKKNDIEKAFKLFSENSLYAERLVPFKKELAVMVAKSIDGSIVTYPVVETIHERNICIIVKAPAQVSEEIAAKANQIALSVAALLEGAGTYGIEMFLDDSDDVIVNEIAPRVHNSGHYTMDASVTSQFEQHIRAITGLPLGDTSMIVPSAVMVNILGERNGPTVLSGVDDVLRIPNVRLHLYGKSPTKVDRKMGHITATGNSQAEALQRAKLARKKLSV